MGAQDSNRRQFASRAARSRRKALQEALADRPKRVSVSGAATSVSLSLKDEAATRALGAALATACSPGSVILLRGPLGAGKTTLVNGFAKALDCSAATSPTFVIAHSYSGGRIPIWHVDLYRIESDNEIADLDLAQYLSGDAITICEWPERAHNVWPDDVLTVEIAIEGHMRRAMLSGSGPRSSALVTALLASGVAARV